MIISKKQKIETNSNPIMSSNTNSRLESFDTLKFLLAFLVVVLHTGFTGLIGLEINAISRIAVPLFFMITGYYLPTMTDNKFNKHLKKIVYFTILSTLFYTSIICIKPIISGKSFDWFSNVIFNKKNICDWLLFNSTNFISGHLWYFYALLYALIIIYFARKFNRKSILQKIIPILFLGNYILSYFDAIISRNFLFTALPYILLGWLFRNKEKQITNIFHKPQTYLLVFILICIGLGFEIFIYKFIGVKIVRDHYLLTCPMAICIFLMVLRKPHFGANSIFTVIGKKYSAYIYIMHAFIIFLIRNILIYFLGKDIFQNIIQNYWFKNCYPFLVFITTLIVIIICNKLWILLKKIHLSNKITS